MSKKLANKTLIWSLAITLIATLAMYFSGHTRWAYGFLTGAGLSIFSLATISLAVRWLMQTGVPPSVGVLLNLALWLKLPTFAGGLYFIAKLYEGKHTDALLISIAGMGLVPALVTMKATWDVAKDILNSHSVNPTEKKVEFTVRTNSFSQDNSEVGVEPNFTSSRPVEALPTAKFAGKGG